MSYTLNLKPEIEFEINDISNNYKKEKGIFLSKQKIIEALIVRALPTLKKRPLKINPKK